MGPGRERRSRSGKESPEFEEVKIGRDEGVFTTGVVTKILGIPVWVLKKLDAEGIVSPHRESDAQSRLYSKRQLSMLKHCWYYIDSRGVNIQGLKIILKMEGEE